MKFFRTIFLFSTFFPFVAFANYANQGFSSYQETPSGISFSCKKQCFIALNNLGSNDYLSLSGVISGSGSIGYGFLNGQQIIPGEFRAVGSDRINERMFFADHQYYSQIPKEFPIIVIIEGNIAAQGLAVHTNMLTMSEKWARNMERFWKTENLSQYSINLLYGYFIGQTSLTWVLSLLFIILSTGIVFIYGFESRRFFFPIFLVGMICIVLYDLREHVNLSQVRKGYYDEYVNMPVLEQKNWYGIGYYRDILEKASHFVSLSPSSQKVYLAAAQDFPLLGYSQYNLHPAETIFVKDAKEMSPARKGDIFIRYFSPITVVDGWETVYASQDGVVSLSVKQ